MVLEILRANDLQIDEILDLLETQLTSSEVFTALFELEMAGRMRLAGKELREDAVGVSAKHSRFRRASQLGTRASENSISCLMQKFSCNIRSP